MRELETEKRQESNWGLNPYWLSAYAKLAYHKNAMHKPYAIHLAIYLILCQAPASF